MFHTVRSLARGRTVLSAWHIPLVTLQLTEDKGSQDGLNSTAAISHPCFCNLTPSRLKSSVPSDEYTNTAFLFNYQICQVIKISVSYLDICLICLSSRTIRG